MIFLIIIILFILILFFYLFRHLLINMYLNLKGKNVKVEISSLGFLNVISLLLAIVSIGFTIDSQLVQKIAESIEGNGSWYLTIFLFLLVLLFYRLNKKDDKILLLEDQLSSDTKQLWKNYAELNEFYKIKTLNDKLTTFVNVSPHVISVQRYKYRIIKNNLILKIILKGEGTHVREGDDINLVSQAYFSFELADLNDIITAYTKSNLSAKTKIDDDDDHSSLMDLLICYISELRKISANEYTDQHSFKFELLKLIHQYLEIKLGIEIPLELEMEQIDALDGRKSGIDIAMFLLKDYINVRVKYDLFDYKGITDTKKSRMYSNIQIENPSGEKTVYVLAHHPDESWSKEKKLETVIDDTQKFLQLVKSEIHLINNS